MKKNPKHVAPAPKIAPAARAVVEVVVDDEAAVLPVDVAPAEQERPEDAPAAVAAPVAPAGGADARKDRRAAVAALSPGRRKFAAKSALGAAVAALDAFDWSEWGVADLAEVRAAIARAHEQLATTSLPRGKSPGFVAGAKVRIREKHAAAYAGALDAADLGSLTIGAVVQGLARIETPSGLRVMVPVKHLEAV